MKKVTVIIPTKNGGALFSKVLDAVRNQKTPWAFHTLVVDSGSVDGTRSVIKNFSEVQLLEIDPQEFQHGATRNKAISICESEFVALITQDALPANEYWLHQLVIAAESETNTAGAFGRHIAYPDCDPFIKAELSQLFSDMNQHPPVHKLEDLDRYHADQGYRQFLHFFSNNNSCLRKSVWESFPFPEVNFAEDQAWANHVIQKGHSIAYAHESVVFHSHTFGILETFQRAFDESRAMNQLFGYNVCGPKRQIVRNALYQLQKDKSLVLSERMLSKCPSEVLIRPAKVIAKQFGAYLGQQHQSFKNNGDRLSLDNAKKLGLKT